VAEVGTVSAEAGTTIRHQNHTPSGLLAKAQSRRKARGARFRGVPLYPAESLWARFEASY